jgi:hypothetical protein
MTKICEAISKIEMLNTRPTMYSSRPNPKLSDPNQGAGRVAASAISPRKVQNNQTTTARTIAPWACSSDCQMLPAAHQ